MGSIHPLTKRTLTAGVIRYSFYRGIARSRAGTLTAKGPTKPPPLLSSVVLSHVLKLHGQ